MFFVEDEREGSQEYLPGLSDFVFLALGGEGKGGRREGLPGICFSVFERLI